MRIKEVIKEKGLTLDKVAERMGIKSPSLSRAISGNTTIENLEKIAAAIGVPVTELFEPESDIFGVVVYSGITYKINNLESFRSLQTEIDTHKAI